MSETWLRASCALASLTLTLTAGAPQTTLSVTIQWNVTAPNSSVPRLAPRHESRVPLIAEFSQEPKLHHVEAQDAEVTGTHDSRPSLPFTHAPQLRIPHRAPPPTLKPPHRSYQQPLPAGITNMESQKANATAATSSVPTKHEFSVDMTCEACANTVTHILNKLGGVQFDIDLPNKKVCITSEHGVDTLLETLGKTGKAVSYLGPK